MSREKLLNIEPDQNLSFHFEVGKQASSAIRLSNNSQNHVAFKFLSSNQRKMFYVQPRTGIISPGSFCDVKVTMVAPEVPSDIQCTYNLLIKSVYVPPWCNVQQSQQFFKKNKYEDGDWELRVVYVLSNLDRSGQQQQESTLLNGSTVQSRSLNDTQTTQQVDINGRHSLLRIGFVCVIFGYLLIIMMFPLLWSATFITMVVFVIKMVRSAVFDSIEDWIKKTILYLCLYLIHALFRRFRAVPDSWVSNLQNMMNDLS